jgi:hypothetical protein
MSLGAKIISFWYLISSIILERHVFEVSVSL